MEIPRLRKQGKATQLIVDGQPFLILGGELGNSAASSVDHLDAIWPRLAALGLNTALVPVYWELMEPEEGRFDFTLVDAALDGARRHGLRLVLLWFGTWKNSMSCYVPGWIKSDQARFPRAQLSDGRGMEILSAFGEENLRVDARAFAALMRHLRDVDGQHRTVLMVQVENEVGMLEDAAERGAAARAAFAAPVPPEIAGAAAAAAAAGASGKPAPVGSWAAVFGEGPHADEAFTAWSLARYVDAVARAGKAEYPLPMFVNAALNRPNRQPGEYPSGGPLPHLFEIWRAAAPTIDFLAPDIYFPEVARWCDRYARPDNPLFVPEISNRPDVAADVLYPIGRHDAIGVSPFAIDTIEDPSRASLASCYAMLAELAPLLLERQGQGQIAGVLFDDDDPSAKLRLGGWLLEARHDYTWEWSGPARLTKPWPRAAAIMVALGPDEFLMAGNGVIVTFVPGDGAGQAGISSIDEGRYEGGRWIPGRRLNGDESHQGRHLRLPCGSFGIQRVRLYRYR